MNDVKKRAIAVTSRTFWETLKEMGVHVPENCAGIIVESQVGDVVRIYYRCFADDETAKATAAVVFKVESELAEEPRSTHERALAMYAAYWRVTTGLTGEGYRDAWEMLSREEMGGWYAAVGA